MGNTIQGPKTWSSDQIDKEINSLEARGAARDAFGFGFSTGAIKDETQLDALREIKKLQPEIEKLVTEIKNAGSAQDFLVLFPRLMAASKELDAANWKYEHPLEWFGESLKASENVAPIASAPQ